MYLAASAPEVVHALRTMLGAEARRLSIIAIVRPYLAVLYFTPLSNNIRTHHKHSRISTVQDRWSVAAQ